MANLKSSLLLSKK